MDYNVKLYKCYNTFAESNTWFMKILAIVIQVQKLILQTSCCRQFDVRENISQYHTISNKMCYSRCMKNLMVYEILLKLALIFETLDQSTAYCNDCNKYNKTNVVLSTAEVMNMYCFIGYTALHFNQYITHGKCFICILN